MIESVQCFRVGQEGDWEETSDQILHPEGKLKKLLGLLPVEAWQQIQGDLDAGFHVEVRFTLSPSAKVSRP